MNETREITDAERKADAKRSESNDSDRQSSETRSLEKLFALVEGDGGLLSAIQQIKSEVYRLSEKISSVDNPDASEATLKPELETLRTSQESLQKSLEEIQNSLSDHFQSTSSQASESGDKAVSRIGEIETSLQKLIEDSSQNTDAQITSLSSQLTEVKTGLENSGKTVSSLSENLDRIGQTVSQTVTDFQTRTQGQLDTSLQKITETLDSASGKAGKDNLDLSDKLLGLGESMATLSTRFDKASKLQDEKLNVAVSSLKSVMDDRLNAHRQMTEDSTTQFDASIQAQHKKTEAALRVMNDTLEAQAKDHNERFAEAMKSLEEKTSTHKETLASKLAEFSEQATREADTYRQNLDEGLKQLSDTTEKLQQQAEKNQEAAKKQLDVLATNLTDSHNAFVATQKAVNETVQADVKGFTAEMLTLQTHFESFSEGQALMVKHFETHERLDKEAQEKARVEEARTHNDRGTELYHQGALEAALETFQKALEINPDMAEGYNNLGLTFTALKKPKDAVGAFKKALHLAPEMGATYHNLGLLYFASAEYPQAIEMFKKSLDKEIDRASAFTSLGYAYQELDKLPEAISSWEKALDLNPSHEPAREALDRYKKQPQ